MNVRIVDAQTISPSEITISPTNYGSVDTGPTLVQPAQKMYMTIVTDSRYANFETGRSGAICVEGHDTLAEARKANAKWLELLTGPRENMPPVLQDVADTVLPLELVPQLRPRSEMTQTLLPAM